MKITIVGPAYPYRGGIALFDEMLARTFIQRGHDVDIKTFTLQYPRLLFPGKTQYSESPPPEGLRIERCVNSIDPFNWKKVGRMLKNEKPDLVVMKYWTPFMAPALGRIARIARKNGHTRVIVQVDNINPHESHFTDRILNRYFINSVDGFVYMSEQVKRELESFDGGKPALFAPHPIYDIYGEAVARREAITKLGLQPGISYSLFFGIIRDYKGLDLLLDAWKLFREAGKAEGHKLIVAGEFYTDKRPYLEQIDRNGLREVVILHDHFIRDDMVRYYFSAADLLIQTYKSATQSGVTQIAYNFGLPMIVTNVGGLAEIVRDGVSGIVAEPEVWSIANALGSYYEGDTADRLKATIEVEKKRFSWNRMAETIEEAYRISG